VKILLAEDDERLGELICYLLQKKGGYQVEWLKDGAHVYAYATQSTYDLLILDWMMPVESGVAICKRLRDAAYQGTILMLTARDALEDKIEGLDAGADDYLVKPYESVELLARIRALLRRNFGSTLLRVIESHGVVIDLDNRSIAGAEGTAYLSTREVQLLELFVRNKGQVLEREHIFDQIWGLEADASLKIIDATVKLLRKKLMGTDGHDFITSIRGVGYRFDS
jgi:DNA-binding response OmpR family regulator